METSKQANWNKIESFVGFGRRDAPVVFIGLEEALDSDQSLKNDLLRRSSFDDVMDIEIAHRGIANAARRFDPQHPKSQRTWRPMCDLMLRRGGNESPTKADRNQYQATMLGRINGETLLTELLPYPHSNISKWCYPDRYASRKDYEKDMMPRRKQLLRNMLTESNRELIVCYGKAHWLNFMSLFDDAIWHKISHFRISNINRTRVVLTTHFSHSSFNSDQQLADFANVALEK